MMKAALIGFSVAVVASSGTLLLQESEASMAKNGLPTGWKAVSRANHDKTLELIFAVKQNNVAELQKTLMAVSDPRSKTYGQHLSNDDVHRLVAPSTASLDAVHAFLREHGVAGRPLTPNSDLIAAKVTVAQAEAMLDAEYHVLQHNATGLAVHRAMSYSLPAHVAAAVDFVSPTVHVPAPGRKTKRIQPTDGIDGNTPPHLRELYNVGKVEGTMADNKMGVTAFLQEYYSEDDLELFWVYYCDDDMTCGQGQPTTRGDGVDGDDIGIESMLDIETITGIAGNVHSEFWGYSGSSPDNSENEPFMKWLAQMSNTSDAEVPKVMSTSYGEDENSWSRVAAERLNTEFMKAGTRGITLLYASGDEGANCKGDTYVAETPGSSPWVTSVGGTHGATTETAIGLSSGGFSDYWPMPDYQKEAVEKYLSSASRLPPASAGYNRTGRAYPDIAAQASNFIVVANHRSMPGVAGTSCATPAAAGIIALLNDARLAAGKPVLGFINPWIYQNAGSWNDITAGASNGCYNDQDGWPAAVGWDAVTGVGTPNYAKLASVLP